MHVMDVLVEPSVDCVDCRRVPKADWNEHQAKHRQRDDHESAGKQGRAAMQTRPTSYQTPHRNLMFTTSDSSVRSFRGDLLLKGASISLQTFLAARPTRRYAAPRERPCTEASISTSSYLRQTFLP